MEKITLQQASSLTSPNPLALVCTQKTDGSTNIATVSWWSYVSFKPGMVVFAMSQKSFSGECVRDNKKTVITIPGSDLAETVLKCGSISGRNTDKIKEFNIKMQKIPGTSIDIPANSKVAMVCEMKEYKEVGDHYLYICEVEDVFANPKEEALFAWNGYSEIRNAK